MQDLNSMHVNGLKVNASQIGAGIYRMIEEAGEAHIVAFGMIPQRFMNILEDQLRKKLITEKAKQAGCTAEELIPFLDEGKIRATVNEITRAVSVAIIQEAANKGKMLV